MNDLKARVENPDLSPFERLVTIMQILRSDRGCAWDRKQTHESLLPYLIEEAYEVHDSIEEGADAHGDDLKEELGDLMCQVVFHAQIAAEDGRFTVDDSINAISDKLIRRHPHIFEESRDLKPDEVRDQWEKVKVESGEKKSVLSGLPRSMPALTMAFRIGEKAGGVGFDWDKPDRVIDKLVEEIEEIKAELANGDKERLSDEIGDMLFAAASLARKLDIDPELALKRALDKFRTRFDRLESRVRVDGGSFDDYSLEQLEAIWQQVK